MADLLTKSTGDATASGGVQIVDEKQGIVRAIVAVTGVPDLVGDLITPGSFAHTLTVRNPKVVDDHQWGRKAGRTLHVIELLPLDPRLPKKTKDGKPWPEAAGALVATMKYNLRARSGEESFEWVRFYAEANEAEFSIGYKVPDGKARTRRDGVRVILMIDLYEFSHVLFGAHPLTMALDVKDIGMGSGSGGTVTRPALGSAQRLPARNRDDDEDDLAKKTQDPDNTRDDFVSFDEATEETTTPPRGDDAPTSARKTAGDILTAARADIAQKRASFPSVNPKDPTTSDDLEGSSTPLEEKSMNYMSGSFEEKRNLLESAVRELLTKDDDPDKHTWVCVRATFPTEVVVTVEKENDEKSYLITYSIDGDEVELGAPQEVELSVVAKLPDGEGVDPEEPDEIQVAEMMAAELMSKLTETKGLARIAGVTSSALRQSALDLFESLGGKMNPAQEPDPTEDPEDPEGDEGDESDESDTPPPAAADTAPAPADTAPPAPDLFEDPADEPPAPSPEEDPEPSPDDDVDRVDDEDDLETKGGDETPDDTVTIDPDEHFTAMKELDAYIDDEDYEDAI